MGKKDFNTPKAFANRQKAKGLGRLRWYCQMCAKQCRDANGFKCHTQSEGHIRQMAVFKTNTQRFMDDFSREFERNFVNTLSSRHNTKRVKANKVYQEMIADRHHVHMNATFWGSLSAFVKHLGQKGVCKVEDTDLGWYITWIDRDPRTLARLGNEQNKKAAELDSEERHNKEMELQRRAAEEYAEKHLEQEVFTGLESKDFKIELSLGPVKKTSEPTVSSGLKRQREAPSDNPDTKRQQVHVEANYEAPVILSLAKEEPAPSLGNVSEGTAADESVLKKGLVDSEWLLPGIVVKLRSKRFPPEIRKKKAVVLSVDASSATVRVLDKRTGKPEGKKISIQAKQVETVVPSLGSIVAIVSADNNYPHRGETAKLTDIDVDKFCVKLKLTSGKDIGRSVKRVPYECVCKVHI